MPLERLEDGDLFDAEITEEGMTGGLTVVAICTESCTVPAMGTIGVETTLSVTDATQRGVARLVADAERGAAVIVSRRGKPAAAVVGVGRLESILQREDDLRSAALVLARAATDTGARTSLDDVISALGFDRDELEAELEAELKAARRS